MAHNSTSLARSAIRTIIVALLLSIAVWIGNLVKVEAVSDITYVYDDLGRLVAVIDPSGDTAVYTYDAVGNLLSISRFSSSVVSIIHFSPGQGPVGTPVTIYGTSFSTTPSQNTITFNGVAATVTSATATQIVTSVPSGATTGSIAITTPSGSATSSAPFTVTTSTAPTISSFTPTIGTSGTSLTINGTNFDTVAGNDWVTLNTRYALVSSATTTAISTIVPSLATSGRISVATPAGKATSTADFFVPPSPYTATDVEVTGRMAIGESRTVTIGSANKIGMILFDAVALQRVSIKVNSFSMTNCSVSIYKPDGAVLTSAGIYDSSAIFDTPPLPANGTYTILIDPASTNTGSINFTLYDATDATGTIIPGGASVTITTTVPGQNARLTFNGSAGQRVSLQLSNSTFTGCYAVVDSILAPDGTTLVSGGLCNATGFIDTVTLPTSGTYTLLIDPSGATTGSQTLLLNDVPADVTGTIVPGGSSVTITTTTPGQNANLTFSGTAGQRISLKLTNSTFTGCFAVNDIIKKPDATTLTSTGLCSSAGFVDTATLPTTGTYTIFIDPQGTTTGSQTLLLIDVPSDITGSITPGGSSVTLTTTVAGQNAQATFSGTANQRVSLKVTGVSYTGGYYNWVSVSIKKPDGTTLTSSLFDNSGGFIDVQTLPVTGTYTIFADPWDSSVGSLTLTLYDVPVDTSVSITPGGSAVTVTNTIPGQNGRAIFTGAANQRVSFSVSSVSYSGGYHNWSNVYLKNPDGSTITWAIFDNGSTGFFDTQTLASADTYTILVDPWDTAVGSLAVTLYDVPADAAGTITVGGSPLTLTTTVPGQNAKPTFSGTANQQISVAFTNNTMGTVTATLLKPDGTSLTSSTSSASSFTLATQTLPTTGTYSVKIDPSGPNTGSIAVSASEVTSSATLKADYQLQNTRSSSVGSPPDLADLGTNSFTTATVDGTSRTVLTFSQNNGLSLSSTSGVLPNDAYTVVMLFSFEQTSGYRRILDFKNGTSDNGLYQQYGHLYFYPSGYGSPVSISANTYVQVVLTRDSTGTVTGYVDGTQQFQFSDSSNYGVIDSNNTLRFFRDDGSASEASPGSVARIRIYDGALTATQVSALSRLP